MSCSLGNKISSGSFGDVYKVKAVFTKDISDTQDKSQKHKENYALKVIQNTHYGIRCLAELFILLFLNYNYIMNCFQFHIDLKGRMTKILMPLAAYDFKAGLMKYLNKKSVQNNSSKNKIIDIKILWQIVCAIGFLHSKGIVHGDVKPSNILLYGNDIKLTDFSLSSFHINEAYRINIKESYTENYRPPEVWNSQGYTYKGDIWALGCTFHELVYNKKYIIDIASKDLQEEEDKVFKNLLEGMLTLDENKRYSIWDVINHEYFKDCKKDNFSDILYDLNYPKDSYNFHSEEEFVNKLMILTDEYLPDIPKYVYEIITMKLFRRTIDKSYFKYLDIFYIEYETKIVELLWNKKLGFELFK
jgi:serine/threonine protein kinase